MKLSATISLDAPMDDPILFRGPFEETIPLVANIGYDGVELHISDPKAYDCDAILRLCQQNHLEVSSLATGSNHSKYGYSLSSPDAAVRREAVECIKRYIELGEKAEAPVIIGLIKGLVQDSPSYEAFEAQLTQSLLECLEYAEDKGVALVLEAINRYESDSMNTIASVIDYLEKINHPNLLLHIDTFHMHMEEGNPIKSLLAAQGKIGHAHYVDSNCQWPGSGTVPFRDITTVLLEQGYTGYFAVECLPVPSEKEAATLALSYLRNLKKRI